VLAYQVLQMETKVLDYLDFHLTVTTTFTFMQRYLKAASACPKTKHLASYLSELSLPAYDMLKYTPSQVGAASVYLARKIMSSTQDVKISQIWVSKFEFHLCVKLHLTSHPLADSGARTSQPLQVQGLARLPAGSAQVARQGA
jgi:hypothetical protein